MEWQDEAIVLSARPHGESALIVQLMTREQGRHAGLVRGGQSRRNTGTYQPGSKVRAAWRGRLAEHLGQLTCETTGSPLAHLLDRPGPLAALASALAVTEQALPERAPYPRLYEGLDALLGTLAESAWAEAYIVWELQLLALLGFGLDLERCAATGGNDSLAYVSPRTGRAVSLAAGEPYRDRLLPLPPFLLGQSDGSDLEVAQGLRLTGHFLERSLFHPQDRPLPPARQRLANRFQAKEAAGQDPDATAAAIEKARP